MDFAYYFIIQNGGIDTEKDYAYTAVQGQCNVNKENRHVVTIDSYEDVPPQDEASLEKVTPCTVQARLACACSAVVHCLDCMLPWRSYPRCTVQSQPFGVSDRQH